MSIITALNSWLIIPVLLAGLFYASVLYIRHPRLPFSNPLRWLLFGLRFFLVSLIAFLLLSPHIVINKKHIEKPVVLIAQDNSASIIMNDDSSTLMVEGKPLSTYIAEQLPSDFDVRFLTFDAEVYENRQADYTGQRTDISRLLSFIANSWYNRNVGAVVLLSDGIHNSGIQPELAAASFPFAVNTLTLGDTSQYPDLSIVDVRYNQLVYKESDFTVEVSLKSLLAAAQQTAVEIWYGDEKLAAAPIAIQGDRFSASQQLKITPPANGLLRLTARVKPLENERLTTNNDHVFYVDVVNEKQRILLLAPAPHPDLGVVQSVLKDYYDIDQVFKIESVDAEKQYELIVLHNLPAGAGDLPRLERLLGMQKDAALFFITGSETDQAAFNQLQQGIRMVGEGRLQTVSALPAVNGDFGLFTFETDLKQRLEQMPPLQLPLAEWQTSVGFQNLATQKINGISTGFPLIGFVQTPTRTYGFVTGNGWWQWRLADYQMNGNHRMFNQLLLQTAQYLMVRKDQRRLRIYHDAIVMLHDALHFRAEYYNPSMVKANDKTLSMKLKQLETAAEYDFVFVPSDDGYVLNAGRLPAGKYVYQAQISEPGGELKAQGEVVIERSTLESMSLKADHGLLARLATETGGKSYGPGQLQQMVDELRQNPAITSIATYSKVYDPLPDQWFVIVLLMLLLSAEWILRKANGQY